MALNVADFTVEKLIDVDGLVVVVTGGGTGIGLYLSLTLAANGAKVYIIGRRKEVLEQTAKEHGKVSVAGFSSSPLSVSVIAELEFCD
jgi:NAD(P)-dependent dehydrogenase (short-subunit alcohol dehydrogenase family)